MVVQIPGSQHICSQFTSRDLANGLLLDFAIEFQYIKM